MKRLKYMFLLIFFIPVIAFAAPIHITQEDIDNSIASPNVEIESTKMTYISTGTYQGIYLNGGEYTLDSDISLSRLYVLTNQASLTINLNGKSIKNGVIGGYFNWPIDFVINGEGKLTESGYGGLLVQIYYGTFTANNVIIDGYVKNNSSSYSTVNLNNCDVMCGVEIHGGELNVDGGYLIHNPQTSCQNWIESKVTNINNVIVESNTSYGLDLLSFSDPEEYKLTVKNSKISSRYNAIYLGGNYDAVIENTELYSGFSTIYSNDANPKLKLSDLYMKTENGTSVMYVRNTNDMDVGEYYAQFLKEGYMYYKDPQYVRNSVSSGIEKTIANKELWVIKQNRTYTIDSEPTYIIPNDNEVKISVLGDKDLLEGVQVDDDDLEDDEYNAEEGTNDNAEEIVDIKIDNNYLRSLDEGTYTVKVLFANGEAEATLTVTEEDPNVVIPISNNEPDEQPEESEEPEVKGEEETTDGTKEETKEEITNPKTGLPNYRLLLIPIIVLSIVYFYISKKSMFKSRY